MSEILIINGYEYTREEFDSLVSFIGSDIN